jgi:hypothetical protein
MPIEQIKLVGLTRVVRRFTNFNRQWYTEQIKATNEAGDYVLGSLPPYPPQPAGSRYKRTGTLGKTLNRKAQRGRGGVIGTIGSPIIYSPFVISTTKQRGRGPQTTFHKLHGWWTLQNEVKRLKKGIINVYKSALRRVKRNSR